MSGDGDNGHSGSHLDDGIEPEDASEQEGGDEGDDFPIVTVEESATSGEPAPGESRLTGTPHEPPGAGFEELGDARGSRQAADLDADNPHDRDARRHTTSRLDDPQSLTIIAVASGRGGAGKSLLAANMAVYLAQIGKRVVAVDADPAGGTLNHMLGTPRPGRGFGSFLRGRTTNLDELAVDTPVAGVRLVAGEAVAFGSPRPKASTKGVLTALRALSADTVVVDLGPPDSALSLDVWMGADTSILVTLADPASIEATYRFLKSAFLRRLRGERGLDKLQAQLGRPLPAALDLYRMALEIGRSGREDDSAAPSPESLASPPKTDVKTAGRIPSKVPGKVPAMATALAQAISSFRPRFVVSQTRSLGDTKIGPQVSTAAHRRLGHSFDYLGHVETDETVAAAARRHRPVMAEFPEAKICKNIERIVRRMLSADAERPPASTPPRLEEEQTFYEILETEPGVSDEEIRRAFRQCKEIYASGSPVIAGLYDEAELTALHDRASAAHDTLFAPERRRLYDLSLPEADLARAVRRAAQAPRLDPATASRTEAGGGPVTIDADAEVTGAVLRKVREARGLEVSDVAQRTKISERHLRSIEDERFDELPAAVYVRGFVTQIARLLRIDPARAVEGYLRRFHGANGPGAGSPVLKEI